jgi:hypothetical protein
MAQTLEVNIKTTSEVPQAMDKAKSATVSFGKQVEDIQKKFSTSFKDIFLGFVAPMVLLQGAISMISEAIAKAKQDAKEGLDLLAKGETIYASSEEKKMANFFKAKREREDEIKSVEAGKKELARRFMTETPEGQAMQQRFISGAVASQRPIPSLEQMIAMPGVKEEALKRFLESEEGKTYKPIFEDKKAAGKFEGMQGFSSVVGVGSNIALEMITAQLEEQRKQTALLQQIASPVGAVPQDFTKDHSNTSPSRAGLLNNR